MPSNRESWHLQAGITSVCRKVQHKVYIRINIITYHQFFASMRGSQQTQGVDKPHFSVLCTNPVEQYSF